MKIEESCVTLDTRHDYRERRSTETVGKLSFRTALNNAAAPASLAALDTARPDPAAESSQHRVQRLLQHLVDAMLAILSGQKCRPPSIDLAELRPERAPDVARPTRVLEWQATVQQVDLATTTAEEAPARPPVEDDGNRPANGGGT